MNKLITFFRYLKDYLKHGEYAFVFTAIKYRLLGLPANRDRIIKTGLGKMWCRKGSIDFVFANYAYEWNVKSFILQHYKNYKLFIDIGANIGTYPLLLAPKGIKCIAYEPVRENYDALRINMILNKVEENISAFNYGLGEKEYKAGFIYDSVNTGASHLKETGEKGMLREVTIKAFNTVYPELKLNTEDKIMIKIDVEGMEQAVLNGASEFIRSFNNLLIIMEVKHSGEEILKNELNKYAAFKYKKIDDLNIAAFKTKI